MFFFIVLAPGVLSSLSKAWGFSSLRVLTRRRLSLAGSWYSWAGVVGLGGGW